MDGFSIMGYGTMIVLMGMSAKVIVYTILFKKAPELVPAAFVGIKTYRMKRITGECRFMAKWNNNIILIYWKEWEDYKSSWMLTNP